MLARGAREALVTYSKTLRSVIDDGVSDEILVSEGIPWADIQRVHWAAARAAQEHVCTPHCDDRGHYPTGR